MYEVNIPTEVKHSKRSVCFSFGFNTSDPNAETMRHAVDPHNLNLVFLPLPTMAKKLDISKDLGRILYFTNPKHEQRTEADESIRHQDLCWVSDDVRISNDPSKVVAGRGLINGSNQTIERGQLLFVSPPTVSVDIHQVLRVYKNSSTSGSSSNKPDTSSDEQEEYKEGQTRLEQIAETILLKQMKRHEKKSLIDEKGRSQQRDTIRQKDDIITSSFLFLTNGDENDHRQALQYDFV